MSDHLEHFSSADDSDEDDEDYKPDVENGDLPSECESGNDSEVSKENGESDGPRRDKKKQKRKKSQRESNKSDEDTVETGETILPITELDEKQKADALWADFLKDTDTEPVTHKMETSNDVLHTITKDAHNKKQIIEKAQIPITKFVKKVFDFAGDTVEVECETDAATEKVKLMKASSTHSTVVGKDMSASNGRSVKRPSVGGLGSVLGQIGKKSKISTLEKSKLDWNSFKRREGIDEQIQTHNKGKDGYLERQDFLQRTDVRQFQIEKSLRLTKR